MTQLNQDTIIYNCKIVYGGYKKGLSNQKIVNATGLSEDAVKEYIRLGNYLAKSKAEAREMEKELEEFAETVKTQGEIIDKLNGMVKTLKKGTGRSTWFRYRMRKAV